MRISKILHEEQDLVARFITVLGKGLNVASQSKAARPGFFVFAGNFIQGYLEPVYFQKEEVLLGALEDCGFPSDDGPVGSMHAGQQKSRLLSKEIFEAARQWQAGDEAGRAEVMYSTSEYLEIMHAHLEMLRNLINPLLDQSVPVEGDEKAAAALTRIAFGDNSPASLDKYVDMVQMLEAELAEWA
jgi:hemerythrin-like domain-containing protein